MERETVLELLAEHRDELRSYGIRSLALFGSVARGRASATSDVDFLVEFDGPTTFRRYMGLKLFLEHVLGANVDLATPAMIRPEIRPLVERDLLRVA